MYVMCSVAILYRCTRSDCPYLHTAPRHVLPRGTHIVQWSSSLLTTIHITTAASATAPPFAPPAFPPAMMKVSSDNQHSRHRPVACLYSSSILLFTLTCFCVTIWLCLVLCYCLLGHGDLMYNVLAPSILMESLGTFMCGWLVKC